MPVDQRVLRLDRGARHRIHAELLFGRVPGIVHTIPDHPHSARAVMRHWFVEIFLVEIARPRASTAVKPRTKRPMSIVW
jgi:hypothetical protein